MTHVYEMVVAAVIGQAGAEGVDVVDAVDQAQGGEGLVRLLESPDAAAGKLYEVALAWGPRVVGALVVLVLGMVVANWVGRLVSRMMSKAKVEDTLSKFMGTMARYGVLMLALLSVLSTLGIETTSFAAVIAAMGFAVGMSLQGTLGNFASGVMLLFFRPFHVGQYVKVGGEAGTVDAIGLFVTTLDTPDNRRIIIPNGSVFGGTIENVSHHKTRRVQVGVGTDYGADLDKTREILEAAIRSLGSVILVEPESQVVLGGLGDSAIDWKVRAWVNSEDYWGVMDALTRAVKMHLDSAGIGIPYPQQDVHMHQAG